MADFKRTVSLTNVNMPLSRYDLLEWVNATINGNYTKIEELFSGVAYCQMMEQLFPNCIGSKKIKTAAKLEHERLHNWRLLQNAFTRLKFDKPVPIDRLMKGRFQDNFEFLQWFKKFYDNSTTSNSKENISNAMPKKKLGAKKDSIPTVNVKKVQTERCVSPETVIALSDQRDNMLAQVEAIKVEKDFYFKKLIAVETILKRASERGENEEFCKKTFKVLYSKQTGDEEN